jgi:hypothetical protein
MEKRDCRLTADELAEVQKYKMEDYILSDREPVDFKDVVEAEFRTTIPESARKAIRRGNSDDELREFAQQMYVSLDRTFRTGQEVVGIDFDSRSLKKRDDIVGQICQCVRDFLNKESGEESDVEAVGAVEVPEGCVLATVTKTFSGIFLATPNSGGKTLICRFDPSGPIHVMKGHRVVLRPTGEVDVSISGVAKNPAAAFVRKVD